MLGWSVIWLGCGGWSFCNSCMVLDLVLIDSGVVIFCFGVFVMILIFFVVILVLCVVGDCIICLCILVGVLW